MLPTFVIGLREGLEAALIVGIIAAFLRKQGRRDLLRWVFVGVGVAVLLCVAVGVALNVVLEEPAAAPAGGPGDGHRRARRRHGHLHGRLDAPQLPRPQGPARRRWPPTPWAAPAGAARAMVADGVPRRAARGRRDRRLPARRLQPVGQRRRRRRRGAARHRSSRSALGYGIYRGGVRLNLSQVLPRHRPRARPRRRRARRSTRCTPRTRPAGSTSGRQRTVDLTWLVQPGSVQASLLTGMLGIQADPVVIEVVGWLVYLVPVGLYVAWPPGRAPARAHGVAAARSAVGRRARRRSRRSLALVVPGTPAGVAAGDAVTPRSSSRSDGDATVRTDGRDARPWQADRRVRAPARDRTSTPRSGRAPGRRPLPTAAQRRAGRRAQRRPAADRAAAGAPGSAARGYATSPTLTAWIEPRTERVIDVRTRASRSPPRCVGRRARRSPLAARRGDRSHACPQRRPLRGRRARPATSRARAPHAARRAGLDPPRPGAACCSPARRWRVPRPRRLVRPERPGRRLARS